ncbi:MAG: hypothetical protein Q7J06_00090 [Bacteroidales bacterium]|nr:hypothetical protein [Bacteroidales bacterium]
MKTFLAILLAAALQSMFAMVNVCAQAVAIGHVSAEIVESVSASSHAITGFDLKNLSIQTAQSEQTGWNYENVNLGEIKINSGMGVACNVVMKPATLSDTNGNGFTIEPSATSYGQADAQRTDGNQTLRLTGRARMMQGQASGLYQGSYTMVFAYN